MINPYGKKNKVMSHDNSIPAISENGLRAGGFFGKSGNNKLSNGPAFGANRQINASSNVELMNAMASIVKQAQTEVVTRHADTPEDANQRVAELTAAYNDKSLEKFQKLGEVMSEEIWETLGREGFSRKLFAVQSVAQGQIGRVKVRRKDVVAYQVTSDVNVQENRIRQTWVFPPEFYLIASILIEDKEIAQASSDLLDEKFQDGLEAILRQEDLISRALLITGAPLFNDLVLFVNFTPAVLATLKNQVDRWGTPGATMTMAFDLWQDIISDSDFGDWFDPVHQHELILEGRLGSLLGMEIITDGFRYPTLQVLTPGECFVTASPITLGSIVQRKQLESRAIDTYNQNRPARGWFLEQIQGQVLVNGRAVARATRV